MPPFADYLLQTLDELCRLLDGPVRTVVLADTLGIAPRTARWYAAQLEDAGRVGRLTPKSGWLPARLYAARRPRPEPPPFPVFQSRRRSRSRVAPGQLCLPGFEAMLAV